MIKIKDKFSTKMFFRLWWPGMLTAIPYAIGDLVDSIVLGNSMGTVGLAAIAFCKPLFSLYDIVGLSFGLGGANRFSILLGNGDKEKAKKCFNDVLKTIVALGISIAILGIIFLDPLIVFLGVSFGDEKLYCTVRSYLLIVLLAGPMYMAYFAAMYYLVNDNRQGIANIGIMVNSISNVFFMILFVVVLGMGSGGAALSIAVSSSFSLLFFVVFCGFPQGKGIKFILYRLENRFLGSDGML